jgi:threonine synthase
LQAREEGLIKPNDTVVAISTASALKFTDAGIRYHRTGGEYANPYKVVKGGLQELEDTLEIPVHG